jgi:hypothetical protein
MPIVGTPQADLRSNGQTLTDAQGSRAVGANGSGHGALDAQRENAAAENLGGHITSDTHGGSVPLANGQMSDGARGGSAVGENLGDHVSGDAQPQPVPLANGRTKLDAQPRRAVGENLGDQAAHVTQSAAVPLANGHSLADAHSSGAVGDLSSALLMVYADSVDDLEKARIAAENRHRSLIQVKGLADSPEVERLGGLAKALGQLEKGATKELERAVRRHRFGPWVKRTIGVGEKQGGRLIASIGDPLRYVDQETGEVHERTVSKLWAYCGYRPGQKRRSGEKSNWNATAKMRAFLVATSCVMKDGNGQPLSPFCKY